MDGLVFILIGLFLILSVYAFYPWFDAKITPFLRQSNIPNITTLEKTQDVIEERINNEPNNEEQKTKPSAVLEFLKRFVLYYLQPILQ